MTRERKTNIVLLCALIAALLIFIVFAPSYGWKIRQFLTFAPGAAPSSVQALAAQNQVLQSELAQVQAVQSELPTSTPQEIRAMVYSRYPFNFKNELTVNAGSDQGVAPGAAVLFQGVLVGQVQSVSRSASVVQTIFDNSFKMPVRIGAKGYDGLLQGSLDPVIGSIARTSPIATGDVVYAAGAGLPYGLPVGTVSATSTSADSLFEQASLSFAYDINTIQTVVIQKLPQ